jgi:O-antigen ligase
MSTVRALPRSAPVQAFAVAVVAGVRVTAASRRIGPAGMLAPLAVVGALALLQRPRLALAIVVSLVALIEAEGGLLAGLGAIYEAQAVLTGVDVLVAIAVAAAALELLQRREPLRPPALLVLPLVLLALAVLAGAVTGYGRGAAPVDLVLGGRQLPYLVLLPLLAFSVVRTQRQLVGALALGAALAVAKGVIGLLAVAAGGGVTVEGATITYYEPLANWLMMIALLGILAATLTGARDRLPHWLLLATPVLIAALVLSFRRSFWIGLALGALLVVVLGASPLGRRMLIPALALVLAGLWVISSTGFQTQGPLSERVESLRPSEIQSNAEDRYRLDELANVVAEVRRHPVTGLGLGIEWSSAAQPLGIEHPNGRLYVHMVALWYWLKLGVLGLAAYLAVLGAALAMAWRTWRAHPDPLLRAAGLALLCGLVSMATVETVGSFTGVEDRFTVVFGVTLGLLARAYASSRSTRSPIA